jgi:hypothetical protein
MKEIVKKLINIQSKLKAPKSQFNKFGNYAYRNAEDILEAIKPLLAENGLYQTISDEVVSVGGKNYVRSTVTVSDGIDNVYATAMAREPDEQKGMNDSQITGSSSSYARKYALNGMYAIDDTKDADFTNTHGKDVKDIKETSTQSTSTETKSVGSFRKPKPTESVQQKTTGDDL